MARSIALLVCLVGAGLWGCRGLKSERPPVHVQQNMYTQQKYGPQQGNAFFADGRAMRPAVAHAVARGELREDDYLYRGLVAGKPAERVPFPLTGEMLERGRERYQIFCAVCHGGAGDGQSMLRSKNMRVPAPSYLEPRLLAEPIGTFFIVMSNGVRTMPSYASQIGLADRWAIAAYVRALQLAGHASLAQVPADVAASEGWGGNP